MDPYTGEIRIFAGPYAPANWLTCDGSILQISEYQALYSLLSTTYGGDGRSTFGLPDLRGRLPVSSGTAASGTLYPLGQKGGAEIVQLATNELPAHNHTFYVSNTPGTQASPANAFFANPVDPSSTAKTVLFYLPDSAQETVQALLPNALSSVGGNQPHENIQPYGVANYIICTNGNYPMTQ